MQRTTRTRILQEGHPFAATTSAPRAKGSAKIVCEKRISRRNRATGPPSPIFSSCRIAESFTEGNEENEVWNLGWKQILFVTFVSFCSSVYPRSEEHTSELQSLRHI